jgi:hypothetical protein
VAAGGIAAPASRDAGGAGLKPAQPISGKSQWSKLQRPKKFKALKSPNPDCPNPKIEISQMTAFTYPATPMAHVPRAGLIWDLAFGVGNFPKGAAGDA